MTLPAIGIIPARYASTRFPGKPLCAIAGKSMIRRVYEQASKSSALARVIVATDDDRIFQHVKDFGGEAMMTSEAHNSGTARLGEVVKRLASEETGFNYKVVVNIQGDEPFIDPLQIDLVVSQFENQDTQISTLISRISKTEMLLNPNVVKVVTDNYGKAIYFSRSPIPFMRGEEQQHWVGKTDYYKHIGLYAYDASVLLTIIDLPPAPPEITESLEQLRWIYHGFRINTAITDIETVGIDTPEDLQKLTNIA